MSEILAEEAGLALPGHIFGLNLLGIDWPKITFAGRGGTLTTSCGLSRPLQICKHSARAFGESGAHTLQIFFSLDPLCLQGPKLIGGVSGIDQLCFSFQLPVQSGGLLPSARARLS